MLWDLRFGTAQLGLYYLSQPASPCLKAFLPLSKGQHRDSCLKHLALPDSWYGAYTYYYSIISCMTATLLLCHSSRLLTVTIHCRQNM